MPGLDLVYTAKRTGTIKKEIGALMTLHIAEGVEAFTLVPFIEVLGWSKEDLARLNEKVLQDLRRTDQHILYDV